MVWEFQTVVIIEGKKTSRENIPLKNVQRGSSVKVGLDDLKGLLQSK